MAKTAEIGFDPADPELRRDPYPVYRRLRSEAPVWRSPDGVCYFSRYQDCFALFRSTALSYDPTRTAAFRRTLSDDPQERERQLAEFHKSRTVLEVDPPEHTRMRALFSRAFTPRALAEIAPVIDRLADELRYDPPVHMMRPVRSPRTSASATRNCTRATRSRRCSPRRIGTRRSSATRRRSTSPGA